MTLAQWLVTPSGIPILVALVGILSGVVGGTVSQLISGAFKTRGDTRQISLARELAAEADARWQKEQQFEREKLTSAQTRDVCLRFLRAANYLYGLFSEVHWDISDHTPSDANTRRKEWYGQLVEARIEMTLLAPSLSGTADRVNNIVNNLDEFEGNEISNREFSKWQETYNTTLETLRDQMRQIVRLEPPASTAVDEARRT